jgi:uncharacterized membrane protein
VPISYLWFKSLHVIAEQQCRAFNEVPAILMFVIVFRVIPKPFVR